MCAAGRRSYEVDYTAGYATVPNDLATWAAMQSAHEFLKTKEGENRLSLRGEIIDEGGSGQYMIGPWVPGIVEMMMTYRDRRFPA